MSHTNTPANTPPSIFRRLASIFYDTIALAAIWFFAALIVVIILRGEAINPGNPFFMFYLLVTAYAYFGLCWTRSGQTLGMKSWKITLVASEPDQAIDWKCAMIRFAAAALSWSLLGLGFVWAIFDRDRRAWHDRMSHSHLQCG